MWHGRAPRCQDVSVGSGYCRRIEDDKQSSISSRSLTFQAARTNPPWKRLSYRLAAIRALVRSRIWAASNSAKIATICGDEPPGSGAEVEARPRHGRGAEADPTTPPGAAAVSDQGRAVIGAPPSPRQRQSAGAPPHPHVRLSGEEEPPYDDGQNDDDEGGTTGPTSGLPASAGPARMLRTYLRQMHRAAASSHPAALAQASRLGRSDIRS